MKLLSTLILILFSFSIAFSQISKRLYVEMDIYRETHEDPIYDNARSLRNPTFINGLRLGYEKSEKINYVLGIRRINWSRGIGPNSGFGYDKYVAKGNEINLGINLKLFEFQFLKFYGGSEIFHEKLNFEGNGFTDAGGFFYEIDHFKQFIGMSLKGKMDIKIFNRIYLTCLLYTSDAADE